MRIKANISFDTYRIMDCDWRLGGDHIRLVKHNRLIFMVPAKNHIFVPYQRVYEIHYHKTSCRTFDKLPDVVHPVFHKLHTSNAFGAIVALGVAPDTEHKKSSFFITSEISAEFIDGVIVFKTQL